MNGEDLVPFKTLERYPEFLPRYMPKEFVAQNYAKLFEIPKFELDPKTGTINVAVKDMPFAELMQHIADATGRSIDWDPILKDTKITASFNSLPLNEALQRLLSGLNFSFDGGRLKVYPQSGSVGAPVVAAVKEPVTEQQKKELSELTEDEAREVIEQNARLLKNAQGNPEIDQDYLDTTKAMVDWIENWGRTNKTFAPVPSTEP